MRGIKTKISNALDDFARGDRVGERYRLRLAVSRKLSFNEKFNSYSCFCTA